MTLECETQRLNSQCYIISHTLCFPRRVVIATDNKATLDGFRDLYGILQNVEVADGLQCQPFQMSYPGVLKLQWGALDNGGAATVKEEFCYICLCRSSSTPHLPQDKSKCRICFERGYRVLNLGENNEEEELKCYHYEVVSSPKVRGKLQDELAVLKTVIDGDILSEQHSSSEQHQMYTRHPGDPVIDGDLRDIDFKSASASAAAMFSRRITDELASRSMKVTGALHVCQDRLQQQLVNEKRVKDSHFMGYMIEWKCLY